ncbi:MAG: hypothetical protein E7146_03820 [Rikenellaceae bacterium]|nr:hypothetical protein [Rikenellaceae bacterium]
MSKIRYIAILLLMPLLHVGARAQDSNVIDAVQQSVSSYVAKNYTEIVNQEEEQTNRYGLVISQLPSQRYKNTLSLGYGVLFGPIYIMLYDLYTESLDKEPQRYTTSSRLADNRYYWGTEIAFTGITLDYSHRLKSWFAMGVKSSLSITTRAKRHVGTNETLYRNNTTIASLLLNFRFDWLNRKIVTMYSSIGVGMALHSSYYENVVLPMYDAAWVGITVGKRLYGYAELGGGISGLLRVGLGYRF